MKNVKAAAAHDRYLFDSGTDLGGAQLNYLSALLDGTTRSVLGSLTLAERPRCLEIGAGNGSVARMLAEEFSGQVMAVDLDVDHLEPSPGVEVDRYDIRDGVPAGPYDLIHTRFVLVHLPSRREIFARLIDALSPGGWLVIADMGFAGELLTAPEESDHQLWRKYYHAASRIVGPAAGHDYGWAEQVEREMYAAGLIDIAAEHLVPLARGGGPWTRYHSNLSLQAEEAFLSAGLSRAELTRFRAMLADPRFRARFFTVTYTVGQKPPR
ncbi:MULTISPECIES: class I SAM-dependent methyltransferase [unclassified Brevibacterium]|uniref:class I SAM-dependent methyltransferase n=1 Tax=unclassified Brevibacterium TaxID=2614124 RepID=UPI00143D5071|nr:class I SAM-dependent methyltransferase [Brevibacterium sp. S22]